MGPLSYLWVKFAQFVKQSYTDRIKQSFAGVCMGFIGGQHIFFSGWMAHLVGPVWWLIKGIGTVALAFFSSMATAYGAYLVDQYKEKKSPGPQKESRRKRA